MSKIRKKISCRRAKKQLPKNQRLVSLDRSDLKVLKNYMKKNFINRKI